MRYIDQHIKAIISSSDGSLPLVHFLKNYFKQYPVLGSRDRKIISAIIYSHYRCAKGYDSDEWLDKLTDDLTKEPKKVGDFVLANWISENKFEFNINSLFPFNPPFSQGIEKDDWLKSILTQPNLFIRVRKDKDKLLILLDNVHIPYSFITPSCLSLPNGAKIDTLLPADAYVVQDASSQQTGTFFEPIKNQSWYDCCSGAGGKSLLLKDIEPTIQLTVSDRRESILHNLKQRFKQYGHTPPTAHIIDVANSEQLNKSLNKTQFDSIICDVPCSGSGTWARTPEQLYFFNPEKLQEFSLLQKRIAVNVSKYLKPGGRLIYITCSIFKEENEDVVNHLINQTGMHLISSQLINGISIGADSMFVAVLQNKAR
ncbi:MAG: Fmu (Sun) domain protein [Flavipsychrobacter sp.]|jgi:16S rRNA (cytosine967-C5)-methyltransferase|nr:Fmu (Sun) domain protein [Flavipsychrobacter sp.]